VTMIACARAHRHFRRGRMHYWPKAQREIPGPLPVSAAEKRCAPQPVKG
jgi:hypothetical protein